MNKKNTSSNITIWTDGSALKNPGYGGWACIIVTNDIEYEISSPSQDIVTNNQMELTAIINAIEFLFEENIVSTQSIPSNVIIYSDSNYAVRGINEWIERWILSQQKTGNTRPNWDLWSRLYVLKNKLNSLCPIDFKWVKAHSNNHMNNRVDKLARDCATTAKLSVIRS
jgi:ribonuclease HI